MNTGKNLSLTTLQNTSDEVPLKGSHSKILKTKSSLGGHCLIPERQRPLTQTRKNSKKLEKLWVVTQSLETQPFRSQRILKVSTPPKKQVLESNILSETVDGYSVFGNPALPVPENPKAEHPIQKSKF